MVIRVELIFIDGQADGEAKAGAAVHAGVS